MLVLTLLHHLWDQMTLVREGLQNAVKLSVPWRPHLKRKQSRTLELNELTDMMPSDVLAAFQILDHREQRPHAATEGSQHNPSQNRHPQLPLTTIIWNADPHQARTRTSDSRAGLCE